MSSTHTHARVRQQTLPRSTELTGFPVSFSLPLRSARTVIVCPHSSAQVRRRSGGWRKRKWSAHKR